MAKEWSVSCPVCESRLVLDDRTRQVVTHQRGRGESEGDAESARDLDWEAAVKRVRGRVAGGEDRLEAALERERRREQDLDVLYERRLPEDHAGSVGESTENRGHGSVTGVSEWGSEAWMESLESLEANSLIDRARARGTLPGDPYGVEVRRIGGLTVVRSRKANSVFGLTRETAGDFAEAARFLEGSEGSCFAAALPEGSDDTPGEGEVGRALDAAGWRLALLDPVWVCDLARPVQPVEAAVQVRPIEPGEERLFARTLETCFEPSSDGEVLERNVERLARELTGERWIPFLGEADGRAVAAGVGYLGGAGVHLQLAATDPAFRGRGFQRAMIRARLAAARERGMRWAVGGPRRYTPSQRAFRSEGFELGYVKALFTPARRSG